MDPATAVASADERKLRRRRQNRLNQRKSRTLKKEKAQTSSDGKRPFQVDKWRYTYQHDATEESISRDVTTVQTSGQHQLASSFTLRYRSAETALLRAQPSATAAETRLRMRGPKPGHCSSPSPMQDHLLHLIHINVLRGLFDNKLAILASASYLKRGPGSELQTISPEFVFPGRAAIIERSYCLPNSLSPTCLQSTVVHATCIDLMPFPQIRDKMIEQEGCFNWAELVKDLVGNLVDPACFFVGLPNPSEPFAAERDMHYHGQEDDDYTANRDGLILWGPAHIPESWEVTAGFLRKWGWLLSGCEDVIESSNRWRRSRGELPLLPVCNSALSECQ